MNKSFSLLDKTLKWSNITSKISIWFAKVQKVKRVEVNSLNRLSHIYSQVTRISPITIQTMQEYNYSLGVWCWLRVVIVECKWVIVERWLGGIGSIVDCWNSLYLWSLNELFQKGAPFLMRDWFIKLFVFFKRVGIHEENYNNYYELALLYRTLKAIDKIYHKPS